MYRSPPLSLSLCIIFYPYRCLYCSYCSVIPQIHCEDVILLVWRKELFIHRHENGTEHGFLCDICHTSTGNEGWISTAVAGFLLRHFGDHDLPIIGVQSYFSYCFLNLATLSLLCRKSTRRGCLQRRGSKSMTLPMISAAKYLMMTLCV